MAGLLFITFAIFAVSYGLVEVPLTKLKVPAGVVNQFRRDTVVNLQGGLGIENVYYTQIGLGNPPQSLNVIVDSGSSDLIVYSSQCSLCQGSASYNPKASSNSETVPCSNTDYYCYQSLCTGANSQCGTVNTYGSGDSYEGLIYTDTFTLAGLSATVSLSAIVSLSSTRAQFGGPLDGIMGMAYDALAFTSTVTDNLKAQAKVSPSFSMCLNLDGPKLYLGADYSENPQFEFTPVIDQAWYTVQLNGITINGNQLSLTPTQLNNTIVDSGTTVLVLVPAVYNAIYNYLKGLCTTTNLAYLCAPYTSKNDIFSGDCYAMTDAQIAAYPDLHFQVAALSFDLVVPPSQYLYATTNDDGSPTRCGGIASGSIQNGNILGEVLMIGYNIVFDQIHNQVGFGNLSSCGVTPIATNGASRLSGFNPLLAIISIIVGMLIM